MTALAGFVDFEGRFDAEVRCRLILAAQARYGPHRQDTRSVAGISLGRALYRLLPEDEYDAQPLVSRSGAELLVADIRIDNREDIEDALRLDAPEARRTSDSRLLLMAYERWQEGLLDRIVGDFAFALWNEQNGRLIMARDPLGQRPLHFHVGNGFVALASMPRALGAVPEIPIELDERRLVQHIAELPATGPDTFYLNIDRVRPGEFVSVGRSGVNRRAYWSPAFKELRYAKQEDYVLAFREQIDRATKSRLRGGSGLVAAHLSAGYDSSTVAATAARLLAPSGGRVIALTSAAREGFDGPLPKGRTADESPYAALTAAMYPNIEHIVVRDRGISPLPLMDESHRLNQHPINQVDNNLWWVDLNKVAHARGATVMLTGQYGNLTLNAAGLGLLADLVRRGQWFRWWHEARLAVKNSPARWTGVLANSFGPWVPGRIWDHIRAAFLNGSTRSNTPYLLHPDWAARMDFAAKPGGNVRPVKDSYAVRLHLMQMMDQGCFRKGSLAGYGVDERDPTADRRLIEFCFSLPHEQLLKDGVTRPLARAALLDRLPNTIINSAPRGLQGAGWYEILSQDEVAEHVELAAASPEASSILNVERLREMVRNWPTKNWNDDHVVEEYRRGLTIAIAAAHFVRTMRSEV